jgi:hypothetical protein
MSRVSENLVRRETFGPLKQNASGEWIQEDLVFGTLY